MQRRKSVFASPTNRSTNCCFPTSSARRAPEGELLHSELRAVITA
jgi:hypothetical protein